jgi:DNA-binding IclR family transcriptional regulator
MRDEAVKSADRVLDVLELLTSEPDGLTFSDIVARLGWPKSSTHALLRTLEQRGYVSRDEANRTFRVGIRIWEAGQAYRFHDDMVRHALPPMRRVVDAIDETVQLAVRDGRDNVYLAKVDSRQPMQLVSHVGSRIPSHGTGLGKVLLADLTHEELADLYAGVALTRFTPKTITDFQELKRALREVRKRGYALDEEEFAVGLRCMSVPVRGLHGRTVAAMSCSVPLARLDAAKAERILNLLRQAADEVADRMGIARGADGPRGGVDRQDGSVLPSVSH